MAAVAEEIQDYGIQFKLEVSFSLGSLEQERYIRQNLVDNIPPSGSFFLLRITKDPSLTLEIYKEFANKIALLSSGVFSLSAMQVL